MVTGLSPERPDEALMVKIAGIILQLTAERKSNKGRAENQCGEVVQKLIARWLKHHKFGKREINKNSGLTGDCSIVICCLFILQTVASCHFVWHFADRRGGRKRKACTA